MIHNEVLNCLYRSSAIPKGVSVHDIDPLYWNPWMDTVSVTPSDREKPSVTFHNGSGITTTLNPDGSILTSISCGDAPELPFSDLSENTPPSVVSKIKKEKESMKPITKKPIANTKTTGYTVPEITSVTHNEEKRSTTIHWADNTKTTVRVMEGEHYDKYNGFCAAVMKKLFGTTTMAKRIRDRKDIGYIKAKQEEERKAKEAAAAERRAVLERREAKKIVKDIERERRISRMVEEMISKSSYEASLLPFCEG